MKHHSKSFAGFGLLVLSQTMVGINIVGSKFLISSTPVLFLISMRFLLAFIFLLPFHWLSSAGKIPIADLCKKITRRDWILILMQAVCAGALFNFFMVLGLRYTDANLAGIITSSLPALIAIGCWIFLKEKFTLKKIICVGLATLGLIVISGSKLGNPAKESASLLGILLIFIALIPEASYYVLTKLQANRLPIFLMSAIINLINAVILVPIMLIHHDYQLLNFSIFDLLILIIISMSSGLFYVFWYLGSEKVDMLMASLATAVMPISTVLIAWLALGETIDWPTLAGMTLVILSIITYAV